MLDNPGLMLAPHPHLVLVPPSPSPTHDIHPTTSIHLSPHLLRPTIGIHQHPLRPTLSIRQHQHRHQNQPQSDNPSYPQNSQYSPRLPPSPFSRPPSPSSFSRLPSPSPSPSPPSLRISPSCLKRRRQSNVSNPPVFLEPKRSRWSETPPSKGIPLALTPRHISHTQSTMDDEHENIETSSSFKMDFAPIGGQETSLSSAPAPEDTAMTDDNSTRSASYSPPTLPPVRHLQRTNPKRLGLSLSLSLPSSSPPTSSSNSAADADSTPFSPGPPKTPALAMTMGRAATKGFRRPSLLTLITQDAPTPAPAPGRRARSSTDGPMMSSYPHYDGASLNAFSRTDESHNHSTPFGISIPQSSPPLSYASASTSASASASASASSSSTPSSSPPMPPFAVFENDGDNDNDTERALSPYANGPIEIVPGVFLGAEESVFQVSVWGRGKRRVRVLNVAQEIEDPFASQHSGKGKERASVQVDTYPPSPGKEWPEMDYCHLKWSHGEAGLAGIPDQSTLDDFINPREPGVEDGNWGLWKAILYIEDARRRDIPVLIHCQCGVSRSATLIIAYLMALAASGLEPELFGHLSGMQDAYNFVKSKSPCIGPNVSLVFQLVEFARNVTTLLSRYPSASAIPTAWPKREEHEMSEAEWARRRAAFDDESGIGNRTEDSDGQGGDDMAMLASPMSMDEAEEEARYLDEAMRKRKGLM